MTIDENIKDLKRLFSNYELDLPCTDSLNILSNTVSMLEELKYLRECTPNDYKSMKEYILSKPYQQGRADAIDELLEKLQFSFDGKITESTVYQTATQLKEKK